MKSGAVTSLLRAMGENRDCEIRQLFEEHHALVLHSAFRVTGNRDDAQDVLQTVFVRLLKRDELPELTAAKAYFHRAAVNTALDLVRSRKTAGAVPLDFAGPLSSPGRMDQPESLRARAEFTSWLRDALSRLRPKHAELFVLRFIEGYSNQEIANLLGTSTGTVAVLLHRTRERLKQEIGEQFGGN